MNLSSYKYKTELHLHTTPASKCSEVPPETAIENYAKLGYHTVIVSNHFDPGMNDVTDKKRCIETYLKDYKRAVEAGHRFGLHVILGCELRTKENVNDYLLFGIQEDTLSLAYDALENGIAWFSEEFRSENTLLIQAHPFRNGMTPVPPEYLDGIESFNMHPNHNSRVAVASKYAAEHNLIPTIGTDYHHLGHEGLSALLTETELKTPQDVVSVLKNGNYIFEIGKSIVIP